MINNMKKKLLAFKLPNIKGIIRLVFVALSIPYQNWISRDDQLLVERSQSIFEVLTSNIGDLFSFLHNERQNLNL